MPGEPGIGLRTLADVFAYAAARGVTIRLDGTEVQVRSPVPGNPARRAFVSTTKKQNTRNAVITDEKGRTLWAGAFQPGRMHDQTAVRTAGIADLFTRYPLARYYSPGLLHGVLLSAVCGLRGSGGCFEAGVVVVPAGAGLVAASPS